MASTAVPEPMLRHRPQADLSDDGSSSPSPIGSPAPMSSATSVTSLDEDAPPREMVDTFGNEFEIPQFRMKDIRDAIPRHCYERSGWRSMLYVAQDIVLFAATFVLFNKYVTPEYIPFKPVRAVLWAVYTFVEGLFGTGLWVLAHECGHQAFSTSRLLNDSVGWVLHSAMLVPYFSWKISHAKHHQMNGNIAKDMVFVPKTREVYASRVGRAVHELAEMTEEAPLATALHLLLQQLGGWQMYLLSNVTGHDNHEQQREGRGKGYKNGLTGGVNHFNPRSPLYEEKDVKWIWMSDLGMLITGTFLYFGVQHHGWSNMLVWYFIPYLWVNHWLVAITYLQHTDPSLPHYQPEGWNFTRGAAVTVDRDFGFIGQYLFHDIIETHVLHHYVNKIPHYNAREASEAIKKVMGKHYKANTEGGSWGFLRAMWTTARTCQWVEPNEGAEGENKSVLFYRNRNNIGLPPMKSNAAQ
ncbi:hypothetical protein KEM52_003303 [Ascosphaera acerosa]|nr:hypothetical protein KEM52_003303 [Ascosphaera acerosa]